MGSTKRAAPRQPLPPTTGTDMKRVHVKTSGRGNWEVTPDDLHIPDGFSGHIQWVLPEEPKNLVFDRPGIHFHGITNQPALFNLDSKTCTLVWNNPGQRDGIPLKYDILVKFKVLIDPTVTNDGPP